MKKLPVVNEEGRCTGQCCRSFPLNIDFTLQADQVINILRNGKPNGVKMQEGEAIADMIIPIYGPWPAADPQARFTCKHFDGSNCNNYQQRPWLCRDHGVGSKCDHVGKGCTIDQAKALRKLVAEYWPTRSDKDTRDWMKVAVRKQRIKEGFIEVESCDKATSCKVD